MHLKTKFAVLAAVAMVCFSQPSLAGHTSAGKVPASTQSSFKHSTVRLISGGRTEQQLTAGVDIQMADGWKTYWKIPGDSGVPPVFDWSRSHNVKNIEVLWPAPHRYEDITGKSIGYKKRVVFPLKITPSDASRPVLLHIVLDYAICSDICVPARAELQARIGDGNGNFEGQSLISKFIALTPVRRPAGDMINKVSARPGKKGPRLVISFRSALPEDTDILVEGMEEAYFEAPVPLQNNGKFSSFSITVDGPASPADLKGKKLKLTVLSRETSFVSDVTVD